MQKKTWAGWRRIDRQLCLLATFLLVATGPATAAQPKPDFGPNVLVLDPSMPAADMQSKIDAIYAAQRANEFGPRRDAILIMPGDYHLNIPIGFYTQVDGLGASPNDVRVSGNVHADASARNNNATTTFWRAAEGFSVAPSNGTMQWAVSQAAPFRRMHVKGSLVLHQNHGWASGGWMADDWIDGQVDSGTQQQWISRNTGWKEWAGSNWNMVFVGAIHAPENSWPIPPYTTIERTPIVREKPFLTVDTSGRYNVRVPSLVHNSAGISWHEGSTPGRSIPLEHFYIAHPGDSAKKINAELAQGKNLLFTPGIFDLDEPIQITRPDTVVLGLGFATLRPMKGTAAMKTADADGIIIAGLLFDAGETTSPVLLQVGPQGSHTHHARNPISLHDVFFRVGGAGVGSTKVNLEVNSDDTIVDHTWIWRADHGAGTGWGKNLSENGLVVNGADVTVYGLFVEHHQKYQVLWNGNGGRTYFYQSEIPYDPPTQSSYTSAPGTNGWASYKVADSVVTHQAWGLGIYSVFTHPNVALTRAIETPRKAGIVFHDMITVALGEHGAIQNVINGQGGATEMHPRVTPEVTQYP